MDRLSWLSFLAEKIALITAEYFSCEEGGKKVPSVILVGRETKPPYKKVMYRTRVKPYFYMEEDILQEEKPNDVLGAFRVVAEEYSTVRTPWGQALRKLYVKEPERVEGLLKLLKRSRQISFVRLYDAELATPSKLPLRYLLDAGIRTGFTIDDGRVVPVEAEVPLRVFMFDIESLSKLVGTVNPYRAEPICLWTFWDSYTDDLVTVHWHSKAFKPLFNNHKVVKVPSERHLLLYIQGCLDGKYDPDLIAAHNLNGYDLIKYCLRLEAHKLKKDVISPRPFRFVDRRSYPVNVKGRIMVDLLEALKTYTLEEYDSYALEYLTEKLELGIPKVPFPASVIDLWEDRCPVKLADFSSEVRLYCERAGITEEDFRPSYIIYLRNVLDVLAMKAYNEKFQLIEFFDRLRKLFGGLYEDMLIRSQMIESGIRRMVGGKIAFPTRCGEAVETSYRGAFTYAKPGCYKNVAVLDFSREYPSIIEKLNISPETFVKTSEWVGKKEAEYVKEERERGNHVIYSPGKKVATETAVITEPATIYVFKAFPKGILPLWERRMFKLREYWEERERQAIEAGNMEEARRCRLGAEIAKIGANASYGLLSYSRSPFYSYDCGAAVAFCAYLASQKLIELLTSLGYNVVYSDTDSVVYSLKEGETLQDVEQVKQYLNNELAEWCMQEWNIKESPFNLSVKLLASNMIVLCYDDKTEILTEKGWKYFKDLTQEDKVATLNSEGFLEYQVPSHIIKYSYQGPLYFVKNRGVDLLVTPNHRMFVSPYRSVVRRPVQYSLQEAVEIVGKRMFYKNDAMWKGEEKEYFILPSVEKKGRLTKPILIPMDTWLEFLGWFLSEGHTSQGSPYLVCITQKKESNSKDIQECLEKLGFHWKRIEISFIIYNKQLWSYLHPLGKANEKYIPREFLNLPPKQLQILWESLFKGDGHFVDSTQMYRTTSKRLADDIQELLLKTGYAARIKEISDPRYRHGKCYLVTRVTQLHPRVNMKDRGRSIDDGWKKYSGFVYCCSTKNGVIYVRRNGVPVWSGNSKKRYCLKYCWHEKYGERVGYIWKGIEKVRSDSSSLEKQVQTELLKRTLDGEADTIPEYWSNVQARLIKQDYSPIEVAYPTAIRKRVVKKEREGKVYWQPEGYHKTIPAHIKAVIYSNQVLGMGFKKGDKPRRLPIKAEALHSYPRQIEVLTEAGIQRKSVTDIAIDEYYILPEEVKCAIDWLRIRTRLFKKVNSILAVNNLSASEVAPVKEKRRVLVKQKTLNGFFKEAG